MLSRYADVALDWSNTVFAIAATITAVLHWRWNRNRFNGKDRQND